MAAYLQRFLFDLRHNIPALAWTFVGFLAMALIAVELNRNLGASPSTIFSPVGISLAAVILGGYVVWPAIALGSIVQGTLVGYPLMLILINAAGQTLQPLLAYYVLQRLGFDRMFFRLKDMFALVGVSLTVTLIVPTVNAFGRTLTNSVMGTSFPVHWSAWWLAGAVSTLVMTPLLIRWINRAVTKRTAARYAEIAIATSIVVVSSTLTYATPYGSIAGVSSLYITIAALFWLAFRGGVRFTTLALFLTASISIFGTIFGVHEPLSISLAQEISNVHIFNLLMTIFFFVLVSLEEQRRNAMQELQGHTRRLEEALGRISIEDEAKNEFIAVLGHELRNPLASLLSSVEVLRIADPPARERDEILGVMNDRIHSMAHLLEDILDISRITRRKFTLRKQPVLLADVLASARRAIEPVMQKSRQRFSMACEPHGIIVQADPTRLEQIVLNLLHNAAKYTPAQGEIRCIARFEPSGKSGTPQPGHAVIEIIDSGIGIPPDMQARIFEPFVQVSSKTNRAGGIGLGLSLTKSLVELHGGTISVVSEGENKGSTFTVRLPASFEDRPQSYTEESPAPRAVSSRSLRVLIVDDNVEAAQVLGKLLRLRGHDTAIEYVGAGVVEAAKRYRPDVVFLDIGLPDTDGYAVARALRKAGTTAMLIALSGYGQAEDKRQALAAGFDHHLTKPAGLTDIEPLIAQAVARRAVAPTEATSA